ncbi:phosphatidate cytidylyltransferase [Halomonas sp. WWR20]
MLRQRIITALILAPLALAGLFGLIEAPFAVFTGVVLSFGAWEWANLAGFPQRMARLGYVLLCALLMWLAWTTAATQQAWPLWLGMLGWLMNLYWVFNYPRRQQQWGGRVPRLVIGLWVLLPCWIGFIQLRQEGVAWLLFVLMLVWVADIGAYFAGRAFGKRKLAPRVSPGKSWAGVVGGLCGAEVLAVIFAVWHGLSLTQTLQLLIITALVALISVLGDLLESMLKRFRGLKDSSRLLPGHGGVLDRIDSLTAAIPLFALLLPWLG